MVDDGLVAMNGWCRAAGIKSSSFESPEPWFKPWFKTQQLSPVWLQIAAKPAFKVLYTVYQAPLLVSADTQTHKHTAHLAAHTRQMKAAAAASGSKQTKYVS